MLFKVLASSRVLELVLKVTVAASDQLRKLQSDLQSLSSVQVAAVGDGIGHIGESAGKAATNTEGLRKAIFGIGGGAGALAAISTGFFSISNAIQTAIGLAGRFYGSTIGAAEALNAQLLTSQTNLASASRIFKGGIEITDPTEKINASRESLEAAITDIQQKTQSLVGVTSGQVNELFQITLANAADLNNQAKGLDKSLADPIKAATQLTVGWAASLKVIGLPLSAANQEINSIIKGNIDNNSTLAKNLKITNEQVNSWKAQGTLVTELDKRLKTFVAGNAIAANSIDGIWSNIQDYIELFQREFGKPLLQPIINALSGVFALINSNKDQIFGIIRGVGEALGAVVGTTLQVGVQVLTVGFNALMGVVGAITPVIQSVGAAFSTAFSVAQQVLGPVVGLFQAIFNSPVGQFVTQIVAVGAAIAAVVAGVVILGPVIAGIGTAIAGAGAAFLGLVGTIGGVITAFGPLAAIAAAAMTAVGGAVMGVVGIFQQFFDAASQGLAPVGEAFGKLVSVIQIVGGAILGAIGGQVVGALQQFGAIAQSVFSTVMSVMAPVAGFVKDVFLGAFSLIGEGLSGLLNQVTGVIQGVIDNPAFQAIAKTLGINIDEVKKSIDDLNKKTEDSGKKQEEAAKAGGDALQFKAQSLTELGNSYEQLKAKAENAQRAIDNEGSGDPARFAKAAQDLIKLTQQQVELGQISEEEAQKRLASIANNSKIEVDTQQSAQQAIAKIRETGDKAELAGIDQQIKEVESQIKRREISEVEGAKRIADLKKQQLQEQIQASQEAIQAEEAAIAGGTGSKQKLDELKRQQADLERQAGDQSRAGAEAVAKAETDVKKRELDVQRANIDAQLAQVDAARAQGTISEEQAAVKTTALKKQQLQIQLQDLQAQLAQAQAANDPQKVAQIEAQISKVRADQTKQGADAQKAVFDAKLRDFEQKEKQATETVKTAEAERTAEIDKQVAAGTMTREQAEDAKLKATQQRIQQEIAAERQKLAAIQAIEATDPASQKQKDEKILASRQKLAQLTSQAAQSEIQQQEKLKQAAESAKQKQEEAARKAAEEAAKPFENQLKMIDLVAKAIENQGKLLQANQQLFQAGVDLMKSQYAIAADMAASAGDEEAAKQIRIEAKQAEIAAQQQQFEFDKMSLALEQQKNMILLEQAKTQLKIRMLKAESPEEKAALAEEGKLLEKQGAMQEQMFGMQMKMLESKQQGQSLQSRAELAKLTDSTEDDKAIASEALAGARNTSAQLQSGGFGSTEQAGKMMWDTVKGMGGQAGELYNKTLEGPSVTQSPQMPGSPTSQQGQQTSQTTTNQIQPAIAFNNFFDSAGSPKVADNISKQLSGVLTQVLGEAKKMTAKTA